MCYRITQHTVDCTTRCYKAGAPDRSARPCGSARAPASEPRPTVVACAAPFGQPRAPRSHGSEGAGGGVNRALIDGCPTFTSGQHYSSLHFLPFWSGPSLGVRIDVPLAGRVV